jgi:dTDP-4-amino-4,6-dideoxygalactose transaminase
VQNTSEFDVNGAAAILGGAPLLGLPAGETIPRLLEQSDREAAAVREVVASGQLSDGPWHKRATEAFSTAFRVPHVVLTADGSAVIGLALKALDLRDGDLVYVPRSTRRAIVDGCHETHVTPVPAEVQRLNLTIDPVWVFADLARRVRDGQPAPKAILVSAVDAQLPDMPQLRQIADMFGLALILQFEHGPYGEIESRPVTSWADVVTYSFKESNSLPLPEGGAIAWNEARLLPMPRELVSGGYALPDSRGGAGPGRGMRARRITVPGTDAPQQWNDHRMPEVSAAMLFHRIPRVRAMQSVAGEAIPLLDQLLSSFGFVTPCRTDAWITMPCFHRWGFGVDPGFMSIGPFCAALQAEINYEVIPETAPDVVATIEPQFLQLGQRAVDVLRAALTRIARDRDAIHAAG